MLTKIDVLQEDIDGGWRGNCTACPLALALSRVTGHYFSVWLRYCYDNKTRRQYSIPSFIADRIAAYDCGEVLEPFSFEIDLYDVD